MCLINSLVSACSRPAVRMGVALSLTAGLLVYAQQPLGGLAETRGLNRTVTGYPEILLTAKSDDLRALTDPSLYSADLRGELVVYPDSRVAFICGPQLRADSPLNPFPWFDSIQIKHGHIQGKEAPSIPPRILTGVVSATSGSAVLAGKGTRFSSEIDPLGPA